MAEDIPPNIVVPVTRQESELGLKTSGQRRINLIWEVTQAIVALAVTGSTLYVAAILSLKDQAMAAAFLLLSNAFFLVIGFYFGRTNHQRIGGTGTRGSDETR